MGRGRTGAGEDAKLLVGEINIASPTTDFILPRRSTHGRPTDRRRKPGRRKPARIAAARAERALCRAQLAPIAQPAGSTCAAPARQHVAYAAGGGRAGGGAASEPRQFLAAPERGAKKQGSCKARRAERAGRRGTASRGGRADWPASRARGPPTHATQAGPVGAESRPEGAHPRAGRRAGGWAARARSPAQRPPGGGPARPPSRRAAHSKAFAAVRARCRRPAQRRRAPGAGALRLSTGSAVLRAAARVALRGASAPPNGHCRCDGRPAAPVASWRAPLTRSGGSSGSTRGSPGAVGLDVLGGRSSSTAHASTHGMRRQPRGREETALGTLYTF